MLKLTGRSFYRSIGIDTVATMVNDLITCGALPVSVAMHAAVGDGEWFDAPGAPKAKLANEKPKPMTVDYDTLIQSWKK